MVSVFGLSGLRNAYRSVLSAVGSSEINGASRWLEALLELGDRRPMNSAVGAAPTTASRMNAQFLRIRSGSFLTPVGWGLESRGRRTEPYSHEALGRFGHRRRRGWGAFALPPRCAGVSEVWALRLVDRRDDEVVPGAVSALAEQARIARVGRVAVPDRNRDVELRRVGMLVGERVDQAEQPVPDREGADLPLQVLPGAQ